jgi:hypothetical protein
MPIGDGPGLIGAMFDCRFEHPDLPMAAHLIKCSLQAPAILAR